MKANIFKNARVWQLVLALAVFFTLLAWPFEHLPSSAQKMAAITAMTIVLWVTELIPLTASAFLALCLASLLGIASPRQIFAPMADPLVFLFLGGFFIAKGLEIQGLDRRIALVLMSRPWIGGSANRARIALAGVAFLFSMWISNTATAAMLVPVAIGLAETIKTCFSNQNSCQDGEQPAAKLSRYTESILLCLAYACSLGGSTTPIGTAPNAIAIGFLDELAGVQLSFFAWMKIALPTGIASLGLLLLWVYWRFPAPAYVFGLTDEVRHQLHHLGPMRSGEKRVCIIFIFAVIGWLSPSLFHLWFGNAHAWTQWSQHYLSEGIVAMLAGLCMCILPDGSKSKQVLLPWEHAMRIDWSTLYLLGGGLALGTLIAETKLADALAQGFLSYFGSLASEPFGLLTISTLLMITITEFTSNTASTSMMIPVIMAIALAKNIDPIASTIGVTIAASYAFMLPVATPPNAIVYGTQKLRLQTMLRLGLYMDIVGLLVLLSCGFLLLQAASP